MNAALTRRSALRGSAAAALGLAVGIAPTLAASALSATDVRLVAIAAELLDIDTRANALHEDAPEYDALLDRYEPLEIEMADLPADTLRGVMAKVRASKIPAVAGCVNGIDDSILDDLLRLHAAGRLADA